tara:strand:+ start:377 stop:562 length:186 start_codon:yes stop_codon:yes gene_type:complete
MSVLSTYLGDACSKLSLAQEMIEGNCRLYSDATWVEVTHILNLIGKLQDSVESEENGSNHD